MRADVLDVGDVKEQDGTPARVLRTKKPAKAPPVMRADVVDVGDVKEQDGTPDSAANR